MPTDVRVATRSSFPATLGRRGSNPPGLCFHPTDEALVNFYLREIIGDTSVHGVLIPSAALFGGGGDHPQNICRELRYPYGTGPTEFYCHVCRRRRFTTDTERLSASGTWISRGPAKDVECDGRVVGHRESFSFFDHRPLRRGGAGGSGWTTALAETTWLMHEYRLKNGGAHGGFQRNVICRVRNPEMESFIGARSLSPAARRANQEEENPAGGGDNPNSEPSSSRDTSALPPPRRRRSSLGTIDVRRANQEEENPGGGDNPQSEPSSPRDTSALPPPRRRRSSLGAIDVRQRAEP